MSVSKLRRLTHSLFLTVSWFVRARLCPTLLRLWRTGANYLSRWMSGTRHTPPAGRGMEGPEERGRREATAPGEGGGSSWGLGSGRAGPEEDMEVSYSRANVKVSPSDDFYCEYDSTWETEEARQEKTDFFGKKARSTSPPYMGGQQQWNSYSSSYKFDRFKRAAKDMQNYRHNYPNNRKVNSYSSWKPSWSFHHDYNLNFYLGKQRSIPDDLRVHDFHTNWFGDYEKLERVHTFIQWLFPLPEAGMNPDAPPLSRKEIEGFLQSSIAKQNLQTSYILMLDFYGIDLCDKKTGKVKRASNWRERFKNLNSNTHNNLRLTRILKCLGILGFTHYQVPLVQFFLEQTLVHGELPNVQESVLNYFVLAVLNKEERRRLMKFAYLNYKGDEFVWCPRQIQLMWSQQPSAAAAATSAEAAAMTAAAKPNMSPEFSSSDSQQSGKDSGFYN